MFLDNCREELRSLRCFASPPGDLVELSKAKYSRNIVKKFLMYESKPQVAEIIRSFKGHVRKMLWHSEASAIVEYAYNKAILEQRNMLTEELYGNTFQLYKVAFREVPSQCVCFSVGSLNFQGPIFRMRFYLGSPSGQVRLRSKTSVVSGAFLLHSQLCLRCTGLLFLPCLVFLPGFAFCPCWIWGQETRQWIMDRSLRLASDGTSTALGRVLN